jgi:peptidoglycan/LPS O-acetylase OafA/YrhL
MNNTIWWERNGLPNRVIVDRVVFLDYLRAVACLLVVFGHIYLLGTNDPHTLKVWVPDVTTYIFGPDPNAGNPYAYFLIRLTQLTGIGVGGLGVGTFFLISGFVILMTLDTEAAPNFILRRIFRIYPTNFAAVLVAWTLTAAYCYDKNVSSPNSVGSIISSMLVVNSFNGQFTTIPVLWTLEVELFFYAYMALASACFRSIGSREILVMQAAAIAYSATTASMNYATVLPRSVVLSLEHTSAIAVHMTFLLIGSMIYRQHKARNGIAYVVASIVLYLVAHGVFGLQRNWESTGIDLVAAATSLILFSAAMLSGLRWRWIRPLSWFGDISYPLYLVHVPAGWLLLSWLASKGVVLHIAGAITMATVVLLAWVLHVIIERPFHRKGRFVANWLFPKRGAHLTEKSIVTPGGLQNEEKPNPGGSLTPSEV